MARYGYGLLLPDIQGELGLDAAALGAIGAGSYVAYLVAAAAAGAWAAALGARRTVAIGGLLAVAGTVLCGLSESPLALATGVMVAGASCGLVYPPFADAIARLPATARARTTSAVNCGTGYGVAVAAPLAILAGTHWRAAWLGFAVCAGLSTTWALRVLPPRGGPATDRPDPPPASPPPPGGPSTPRAAPPDARIRRPDAARLIAGAVLVGLGSAACWTFGVDHLREDGHLGVTLSRTFLGVAGVGSILGTASGDLVRRFGAPAAARAFVAVEAAALALLALAPSSPPAVLVAGLAFGAAYNAVVAVQALWSVRLWPERPSRGLAIGTAANAVGLLAGPLASGGLADAVGLTGVLLGGAVAVGVAGLAVPRTPIVAGERQPARDTSTPSTPSSKARWPWTRSASGSGAS